MDILNLIKLNRVLRINFHIDYIRLIMEDFDITGSKNLPVNISRNVHAVFSILMSRSSGFYLTMCNYLY
jgi:hypothetical protein